MWDRSTSAAGRAASRPARAARAAMPPTSHHLRREPVGDPELSSPPLPSSPPPWPGPALPPDPAPVGEPTGVLPPGLLILPGTLATPVVTPPAGVVSFSVSAGSRELAIDHAGHGRRRSVQLVPFQ